MAFEQLPHIYRDVDQGPASEPLRALLVSRHEAFRLNAAAIPAALNHFCRGALVRHYHVDTDLREIMNDRLWHTLGIFP